MKIRIGKMIDKEPSSESYESKLDGCWYDNVTEEFWTGILNFCGCGISDTLIQKMFEYLCYVEWNHRDNDIDFILNTASYLEGEQKLSEEKITAIGGMEIFYLLAYIADDKDLTEHGTGISGAWLNSKGIEWLGKLKEYYANKDCYNLELKET